MEEVDKIIVHSLKDIGCNIDSEIEELEQFSTELIVESAVKCLESIQPGLEIPKSLPHNMAARFHVGATIAQACKDLGYNGEVGYQTFLYSNVVEVRRLFMFLIEKLPKESEKIIILADDPLSKIKSEIGKEIKKCLKNGTRYKNLSIPFISHPLETGIMAPGMKLKGNPKDWREYFIHEVPFLTEQVSREHILPSVIVLNAQGLAGGSLSKSRTVTPTCLSPRTDSIPSKPPPALTPDFKETWLNVRQTLLFTKEQMQNLSISDNDNKNEIEKEKTLDNERNEKEKDEDDKTKLEQLKSGLEDLQGNIKDLITNLENVKDEYICEMSSSQDVTKEMQALEKALSLLPTAGENLKKLEDSANSISHEILSLAAQWEKYRAPLVTRYIATRSSAAERQNQSEENFERIKNLKGKIDNVNKHIATKKTMIAQLEEEYVKLPKNINRSAYTRRIMEIIGNIKKQKDQIEKILKDTKELQKEINSLNGRLERSIVVTEETIFRNAKKDEFSKRAFKLLSTLHTDCGSIITMVLEIGTISREITDLREQIEIESSKNTAATLERITADLEQMKSESRALKHQITSHNPKKYTPPL